MITFLLLALALFGATAYAVLQPGLVLAVVAAFLLVHAVATLIFGIPFTWLTRLIGVGYFLWPIPLTAVLGGLALGFWLRRRRRTP